MSPWRQRLPNMAELASMLHRRRPSQRRTTDGSTQLSLQPVTDTDHPHRGIHARTSRHNRKVQDFTDGPTKSATKSNQSVSTVTKLRVLKALVWPAMTHGYEAWTRKKEEERRIRAFEKKCIRKLLRIPWMNLLTTEQACKTAGILSYIKSRKRRYFEHVMRIPDDNIEASVMTGHVEGLRNRGRPGI